MTTLATHLMSIMRRIADENEASEREFRPRRSLCPRCEKDMTPRPGAVFLCTDKECPFWSIVT
jgi:hypothetical protein